MIQLYARNEIKNKHGKAIYYFSKSTGNTELDKFKNSYIFNKDSKEYTIQGKNDTLTCIVDYNDSEHEENCGHFMKVFNSLGELIEDTFPGFELQDDSQISAEEVLQDLGLL
jgi:hypothetical protein